MGLLHPGFELGCALFHAVFLFDECLDLGLVLFAIRGELLVELLDLELGLLEALFQRRDQVLLRLDLVVQLLLRDGLPILILLQFIIFYRQSFNLFLLLELLLRQLSLLFLPAR